MSTTAEVIEQLKKDSVVHLPHVIAQPSPNKDKYQMFAERSQRIAERFSVTEILTQASIDRKARSLIVSGPPGLGKSHTVADKLHTHDPNGKTHMTYKGYVRATGLYISLYEYRHPGNVLVLDDCDFIFNDDTSLSIIKAVCDTTRKRTVSWKTQAKLWTTDGSELIPKTFDYEGSIIFLTNLDFDYLITQKHRLAPHLGALISRSHYIDLSLKNRTDYLIRIMQVINKGMLNPMEKSKQNEIMSYITKNAGILRELSLRMVIKLKDLMEAHPEDWQKLANITCCRTKA